MASKPGLEPLRIRPGARYTCFGDGLCCTDIHVLGPLSRAERKRVEEVDARGIYVDPGLDDAKVMRIAGDGGCHFLLPDQRCSIHAEHGPMQKPRFCRRFPLGLVATPAGGRVTTEHRCPCRTMGERPLLDEESVRPPLLDEKGALKADRRIKRVSLSHDEKVDFDVYRALEAEMLGRLAAGERIEDVLDAEPFPELDGTTWDDEADRFAVEGITDTSAFSVATQWFVMALRARLDETGALTMARPPRRPWAAAFERAAARPGEDRSRGDVFADWVADMIWGLTWTDDRPFDVARAELATRVEIAHVLADALESECAVPTGQAAAEAITIVELVGESELWTELVSDIDLP